MTEPNDHAAAPTGLPPSPWRVERTRGQVVGFKDADGRFVFGGGGYIDADPEVLRAVEALPLLVELARLELRAYDVGRSHFSTARIVELQRAIGGIVDGEGRADD
jgi:hypothetical protein